MKLERNGLVFKKLKRGTGSSENDRNSTTPDKEIWLCSMVLFICVLNSTPPYMKFFPFLYTILPVSLSAILSFSLHNYSCWFPWFSHPIFELQSTFFFYPGPKETVGALRCQLWKDRKELHHPLITGIIRISIRIF